MDYTYASNVHYAALDLGSNQSNGTSFTHQQPAKIKTLNTTTPKKHSGFGGVLEAQSFDLKPPNQNFNNENRKLIIKIFGLAKC